MSEGNAALLFAAGVSQDDVIGWVCIGLVLIFVLGVILWGICLLTEGVEGIARRLYAMLLLLMSAVVVGLVIGVPFILFAAAFWGGVYMLAAAAGIPFTVVTSWAMAVRYAQARKEQSFDNRGTGNSWLGAYLDWIKRVAQGKKHFKNQAIPIGKNQAIPIGTTEISYEYL
jgi:hypothetical protein